MEVGWRVNLTRVAGSGRELNLLLRELGTSIYPYEEGRGYMYVRVGVIKSTNVGRWEL